MATEVTESEFELHPENKFFYGDLVGVTDEDGNFGPQKKWVIQLDGETWVDDAGVEKPRESWMWTTARLTMNERNKFRKLAKGLSGSDMQAGEVFHEEHYTREFYEANPDADPEQLTGRKEPWRVAVMFEHYKKTSGDDGDKIILMVSEESTK